ncbi:MAG: class I SAM-dependent methyltransferase [Desulfobulbus sp.]|nr:class I SAM-dependent methyltransferase [Desulfobulbus sp.]
MLGEQGSFERMGGGLHPGGLELTRRGLFLCGFPKGARIVDIGAGAGASVRLLREAGYLCTGIDVHPQAGDFPMVQAQAEALPLARESLHGIVCECVLSLLKNPERVVKGFWEACRFGGRLLLTDVYVRDCGQVSFAALFSRRELESVLRDAGWRAAYFEDCSLALQEFAGQLAWHAPGDVASWLHAACGRHIPWRALGYGLWIAHKEGQ